MAKTPRYCPLCATPLKTVERGGFDRQVCPDCGWVHWNNPVPVVAAIVLHQNDVILVRNKGWPESWYGLVSGFLEAGEDVETGTLREVEEELGLTGNIVEFVGVYAFKRMNQVIMAYVVDATGEVTMGEELADYKRVPPDRLKPWPMGTGHAVRDWLESRK